VQFLDELSVQRTFVKLPGLDVGLDARSSLRQVRRKLQVAQSPELGFEVTGGMGRRACSTSSSA
jgi:hypothetical protein